ncbi:MAG: hypothetical protein K0B09_03905 [Bacteroidales bacterium]|nr:hypothetical protein [Bacteroidales bacterium]
MNLPWSWAPTMPEYLINAIGKAESVDEISDQLNHLPRLIQRLVETGTGAATPNPPELLKTSIFFDFRPVFGQTELAEELQHLVQKELKNKDVFFFNLAKSIIGLKPPAMDSSIIKQDSFDVKLPIMAITGIARLWALKFGVSQRNVQQQDQSQTPLRDGCDHAEARQRHYQRPPESTGNGFQDRLVNLPR